MQTFAAAAYRWLIGAFVLCTVAQFLLAGAGAFGQQLGGEAPRLEDQESWNAHRVVGFVLMALALALLVTCLAWWAERIWLLGTFLLALLVFVQLPLASAGEDHRWIGALHAANASLVLLIAGWLAYRAWRRDLTAAA